MLKIFLHLNLILIFCTPSAAESWPTFTLTTLASRSKKAVRAKLIKSENNNFYFACKDIRNADVGYSDTIMLEDFNQWFDLGNYTFVTEKKFPQLEDLEEFLLFLSQRKDGTWFPTLSGYRFLLKDTIYVPFQRSNPGKYNLSKTNDKLTWDELIARTILAQNRIQSIRNLKNIPNDTIRNQALLKWIRTHPESYEEKKRLCYPNEICGWAYLNLDMFQWIYSTGIAKDTWAAGKLAQKSGVYTQNDGHKQSFASLKGRQFLVKKSLSDNIDMDYRKVALNFLESNIWYQGNIKKGVQHGTQLTENEQMNLINQLIPLLYQKTLAAPTFEVLCKLVTPVHHDNKYLEKKQVLLPDFIKLYQSLPPMENAYGLHMKLATFIAANAQEKDWKKLTGNDANLYPYIPQFVVDAKKKELRFSLFLTDRKIPIHSITTIEFHQMKDGVSIKDFTLPPPSNKKNTFNIDLSKFEKGVYYLKITGLAGEEGAYRFQSDMGQFEKDF